jgi:hypothetical protein
MSYRVNVSTVETSRGEDGPSSVPGPGIAITAGRAPEDTFAQGESPGSDETPRARHRRAGAWDAHHLSPRPLGTLGRLRPGRTDRAAGALRRQRGRGQARWSEVLDGEVLVVGDDAADPGAGIPVPEAAQADADTAGLRRQVAGARHRNTHPCRQARPAPPDPEARPGVRQARQRSSTGPEPLSTLGREGPHGLLLEHDPAALRRQHSHRARAGSPPVAGAQRVIAQELRHIRHHRHTWRQHSARLLPVDESRSLVGPLW